MHAQFCTSVALLLLCFRSSLLLVLVITLAAQAFSLIHHQVIFVSCWY
uniref:Uncharacterized protein n=1 Tax=Aegilops tauschii subsp. strangulata TaxID=200361 RepID=A0A453A3N6_AEGTS